MTGDSDDILTTVSSPTDVGREEDEIAVSATPVAEAPSFSGPTSFSGGEEDSFALGGIGITTGDSDDTLGASATLSGLAPGWTLYDGAVMLTAAGGLATLPTTDLGALTILAPDYDGETATLTLTVSSSEGSNTTSASETLVVSASDVAGVSSSSGPAKLSGSEDGAIAPSGIGATGDSDDTITSASLTVLGIASGGAVSDTVAPTSSAGPKGARSGALAATDTVSRVEIQWQRCYAGSWSNIPIALSSDTSDATAPTYVVRGAGENDLGIRVEATFIDTTGDTIGTADIPWMGPVVDVSATLSFAGTAIGAMVVRAPGDGGVSDTLTLTVSSSAASSTFGAAAAVTTTTISDGRHQRLADRGVDVDRVGDRNRWIYRNDRVSLAAFLRGQLVEHPHRAQPLSDHRIPYLRDRADLCRAGGGRKRHGDPGRGRFRRHYRDYRGDGGQLVDRSGTRPISELSLSPITGSPVEGATLTVAGLVTSDEYTGAPVFHWQRFYSSGWWDVPTVLSPYPTTGSLTYVTTPTYVVREEDEYVDAIRVEATYIDDTGQTFTSDGATVTVSEPPLLTAADVTLGEGAASVTLTITDAMSDSDDTLGSVTITGVPSGWSLTGDAAASVSGGTWTADAAGLGGLVLVAPSPDESGSFTLAVTAIATEDGANSTTTTSTAIASFVVTVSPVAETLSFSGPTSFSGSEESSFALASIGVATNDSDDTLGASATLSGLSPGWTLYDAAVPLTAAGGVVTLPTTDLGALAILAPDQGGETATLTLTVSSSEGTLTTSGSETLTITATAAEVPSLSGPSGTLGSASASALAFAVALADGDDTGSLTLSEGTFQTVLAVSGSGTYTADLSGWTDGTVSASLVVSDGAGNSFTAATSVVIDPDAGASASLTGLVGTLGTAGLRSVPQMATRAAH